MLPQVPYTAINYKATSRWIGASTAGPVVFAIGNTPDAPPGGREPSSGAGPMEYSEAYLNWLNQDNSTINSHSQMIRNIGDWIKNEPFAFLELKTRMFLLFWSKIEIPNNVSMVDENNSLRSKILRIPIFWGHLLIGGLGAAGILLSILYHHKKPLIRFSTGFVALFCLANVLFYILSRFRVPIIPILCGFCGFSIITLFQSTRNFLRKQRDRNRCLLQYTICLFCLVFVGFGFSSYRNYWEKIVIRLVRPNGVVLHLGNNASVKDHGPVTFGGWEAMPIESEISIVKQFYFPNSEQQSSLYTVRFPLYSPTNSSIKINFSKKRNPNPDQIIHVKIKQGLNWIEQKVDSNQLVIKDDQLELNTRIKVISGEISLIFDNQRDYQRTKVVGQNKNSYGEWVISLLI